MLSVAPGFPAALCGVALLAAEAYSVGLAAGLAAIGPARAAGFIAGNDLPGELRTVLFKLATSAALVALLGALLAARRLGAARLWPTACRLSPLLLAAALPALFNWRAWQGRDLPFLVLVAVFGLGLEALVRLSLASPPLAVGGTGWGALVRHARALRMTARSSRAFSPALIVALAALTYAGYFAHHTIAFHRNVHSRSFDLGLEANAAWNALHGGPVLKSSPFSGPEGSHLAHHAAFFVYALVPLYALYSHPETLLAVQAFLAGAAGVFLFLWARRHLDEPRAALVTGCYFLYPPLHGANLYEFHYQTLAPFFLWLTLWAVEGGRDRLAAIGVLAALALREDVAASVAVLGLYLLLSGVRPRAGAAIAVAASVYFVVMKFGVIPAVQPDPAFLYAFSGLLPRGGRSFEAVLLTVAGNPFFTLGTLLTAPKLVYTLQVLVPLAFLPLRRPLGLLFLLPGFFFTLLSTGYAPFLQISFQYTAHWTGFLFPALVLGLAHIGRARAPHDEMAPVRLCAATVALVATTLACSYQYGAVLQRHTARSGFDRYRFGTADVDRARRAELYALIARIPPAAKVAGSETVVPHISSRPDAYTLRLGVYDAEYLVFSTVPSAPGELERAAEALATRQFGVVETGSLFVLARRGHDGARNDDVLARLAPFLAPPAQPAPVREGGTTAPSER